MASHVVVIDASFRRTTVRVTPATYLIDVLEDACTKFGLEAKLHSLRHKTKPLDLSLTFRQSGLTPGAKLDIVLSSRSPTPVSVALQLPEALQFTGSGGRLIDKFPSDTTLWLVLRKFESAADSDLNLTARVSPAEVGSPQTGSAVYELPVLHIMGRNLSTFGDLQKTLGQLGIIDGTCLIKLDFKKTDLSIDEAKKHIGEYFREQAPRKSGSDSNESNQLPKSTHSEHEIPSDPQIELNSNVPETQSFASSKADTDQRTVVVYSPPNGQRLKAATIPDDDGDYEPTLAHAKLHQQRLISSSQNKRLLSDYENERLRQEREQKVASVQEVSIKIRFPDQSSIVSTFNAEETGRNLYEFASSVIIAEKQPFKLIRHVNGPQVIPQNDKKLIKELGIDGRTLVNFVWTDANNSDARNRPILKPQYIEKAQEIPTPVILEIESTNIPESVVTSKKESQNDKVKKVGKWFKGLGKK